MLKTPCTGMGVLQTLGSEFGIVGIGGALSLVFQHLFGGIQNLELTELEV